MSKVIQASGNEVEPYWPGLFAKALKGKNIDDLLTNVAAAAPAGGAAAAAGGAADEAPEEEGKLRIHKPALFKPAKLNVVRRVLTCVFCYRQEGRVRGGSRRRYGRSFRRRLLSALCQPRVAFSHLHLLRKQGEILQIAPTAGISNFLIRCKQATADARSRELQLFVFVCSLSLTK